MSSRVFKAKTGHTKDRPQICGLSDREIAEDDHIMYLVCHGGNARPEYQIKVTREEKKQVTFRGRTKTVSERDYGMDDGRRFRSVFGGWQQNQDTGKREKVFQWQELTGLDADGEENWQPVKCWSHIVLAQVATDLGYDVRCNKKGKWQMTTAHEGDRAIGNEHTLDAEGTNAMEVLARAACTDEELGLVPPTREVSEPVHVSEVIAEIKADVQDAGAYQDFDQDAEDRELAEVLGMTVEQYRKAVAERG
jgi:hypothetical protein